MSNFSLSYKLSWLPRFLRPSLRGDRAGFAPLSRPAPANGRLVRLVFLGDLSAVANRRAPLVDPALGRIIASADLVVANCESPVVERPHAPFGTRLGLRHAMTPGFLESALAALSIAPKKLVLSLANNHVLDQGIAGFDETVANLGRLGIRTVGTAADGWVKPFEVAGLTIGFSAFTQWRNAGREDFAGRVLMMEGFGGWDAEAKAGVDLICAVPHWDLEFRHFPQGTTRAFARKLAAAGAGLIAGHHSHVVQPLEEIGETFVAYGVGDCLGTAWARQTWPGRIGAMLVADIGTKGARRGRIAGYETVPFMRLREGDRERLVPVGVLEGRLKQKVAARLGAVYPPV
ncbi:metallophosphatase [Mesorhizobium sp. CGMCC 1.15528]|uniref:Metallophosphatase n=1 Tax=Mesorhizobium zhangyense TaxID=1776730 RepID=A0A7C9VBP2_9HYPH|nr:CapA family protein [Mesorhizobium zhangyense]NGN41250.1 metallophosphatase [Mesorhizobium zhangyense]